jgi:hypothetical protein
MKWSISLQQARKTWMAGTMPGHDGETKTVGVNL